jgi:hypothetical protein
MWTSEIFRKESLWVTWQRDSYTELYEKKKSEEIKNIKIHNILENILVHGDETWPLLKILGVKIRTVV